MSGGHFDYAQYRFDDVADQIDSAIRRYGEEYQPTTIARFKLAAEQCRLAAKMVHRVDWLLSDDDGEVSFMQRWDCEIVKKDTSND